MRVSHPNVTNTLNKRKLQGYVVLDSYDFDGSDLDACKTSYAKKVDATLPRSPCTIQKLEKSLKYC